ncbi:hypothetical protein KM043_013720 [Ampulex compressa]|nr:hypothetical protein KM043_013720 [Ampulex compressa]
MAALCWRPPKRGRSTGCSGRAGGIFEPRRDLGGPARLADGGDTRESDYRDAEPRAISRCGACKLIAGQVEGLKAICSLSTAGPGGKTVLESDPAEIEIEIEEIRTKREARAINGERPECPWRNLCPARRSR